jgi:hypothetical protein
VSEGPTAETRPFASIDGAYLSTGYVCTGNFIGTDPTGTRVVGGNVGVELFAFGATAHGKIRVYAQKKMPIYSITTQWTNNNTNTGKNIIIHVTFNNYFLTVSS